MGHNSQQLMELTLFMDSLPHTVVAEHRFHPPRRWRFDWAIPCRVVAIEYEGGIWTGGAHSRGKHFNSDCEKYNQAALDGWKVLRFTETSVRSGLAFDTIEEALK